MGVACGVLLALAAAAPPTGTPVGRTGAAYDAAGHKLEARGAAAADLRAPSAEIARVKAERAARAQAERRIGAALVELGARLCGDEKNCKEAEALGKLLEAASVVDERYGSDGSVELRLVLPTKELDLKAKR